MAHKRARKSGSGKGGKTLRAFLDLLRSENKPWGFERGDSRSWKIEEEVMMKQEDTDMVMKKEDGSADSLDLDLPSIYHIINGRS